MQVLRPDTPAAGRSRDVKPVTIRREDFFGELLPAVPPRHRAIVSAAVGAGLRWGEYAGLTWSSVNLDRAVLRVVQVAEETHGGILLRPYPKSRAGGALNEDEECL